MQTVPAPVRRIPPAPALTAAVLGLVSAALPAVFALFALAFSNGEFAGNEWLLVAVPLLVLVGLVIGAILMLAGRSWLVLALGAGALTALVLTGYAMGGWGGGGFGVLTLLVPMGTTVLAVLPSTRSWVAARRDR